MLSASGFAQAVMLMVSLARFGLFAAAFAALLLVDVSNVHRAMLLYIVLSAACIVCNNVVHSVTRRTAPGNVSFTWVAALVYYLGVVTETFLFLLGVFFRFGPGPTTVMLVTSTFLLVMGCTYTMTGHVMNSQPSPPAAVANFRLVSFTLGFCANIVGAIAVTISGLSVQFHCAMTAEARGVAALAMVCAWLATDAFTFDMARDGIDAALDDNVLLAHLIDPTQRVPRRLYVFVHAAAILKYVLLVIGYFASIMALEQGGCTSMVTVSAVSSAAIGVVTLGNYGPLLWNMNRHLATYHALATRGAHLRAACAPEQSS